MNLQSFIYQTKAKDVYKLEVANCIFSFRFFKQYMLAVPNMAT